MYYNCRGEEEQLNDCKHYFTATCRSPEYAGIVCTTEAEGEHSLRKELYLLKLMGWGLPIYVPEESDIMDCCATDMTPC